MMVKNLLGLDPSSVRSQSALVRRRMAENCNQRLSRRGHTVLTKGMNIELKAST